MNTEIMVRIISGLLFEYLWALEGAANAKVDDPENTPRHNRNYGFIQGIEECLMKIFSSMNLTTSMRGNDVLRRIKYLEHMYNWTQEGHEYSHVRLWNLMSYHCESTARYIVGGK